MPDLVAIPRDVLERVRVEIASLRLMTGRDPDPEVEVGQCEATVARFEADYDRTEHPHDARLLGEAEGRLLVARSSRDVMAAFENALRTPTPDASSPVVDPDEKEVVLDNSDPRPVALGETREETREGVVTCATCGGERVIHTDRPGATSPRPCPACDPDGTQLTQAPDPWGVLEKIAGRRPNNRDAGVAFYRSRQDARDALAQRTPAREGSIPSPSGPGSGVKVKQGEEAGR